jgi:hypothetical protein
MFALFDKNNKNLIGYAPNITNINNISLFKEIPEEFSNLHEWSWEGDYDTGKMVTNKKIISLNEEHEHLKKIIELYPLGTQIINIIRQLHILSKNANLFDNDFKEMSNNILEIMSKCNK